MLMVLAATASALEARPARAAGGAYVVDDVEVGAVGSCKVESWTSFASNSDFIGVVQPACVVSLGRPVELSAAVARFRDASEWGSEIVLKAKTNLIPIEPSKVGVGLAAGMAIDPINRLVNGLFVTIPVSYQLHETVRLNFNGGWLWNANTDVLTVIWGGGFEWNLIKPVTLIGEVFGELGPDTNRDPRAQVGLRFTPQESFDI
ncbi:MAG TPA: hypothetical protein VHG27_00980, partial [Xanthobacteraceae bacterium]|nr:hypothetical protein [Xanthobacteraceae bacterium]